MFPFKNDFQISIVFTREQSQRKRVSTPMFLSFILFCSFPFKAPTMSNEWAGINSTVEGYREEKHLCFLESMQTDGLANILKIISVD